jgi:hypothetical protein
LTEQNSQTSLVVADRGNALPRSPVPTYTPDQMIAALREYRALQHALDQAMPDQVIEIAGRQFRKRGYWRAIGVAFHLSIEPLEERREVHGRFQDGQDNFGGLVSYKATAPNGRAAIGDGCVFAVEKAPRFRCPHPHPRREGKSLHYPPEACPDFDPAYIWRALPLQATEHNIRSHAHTRAYNRAISNLVGFAETPAEEIPDSDLDDDRPRRRRRGVDTIDDTQRRRLFERAEAAGWTRDQLKAWLAGRGITDTSAIARTDYDAVLDELLIATPAASS